MTITTSTNKQTKLHNELLATLDKLMEAKPVDADASTKRSHEQDVTLRILECIPLGVAIEDIIERCLGYMGPEYTSQVTGLINRLT